MGLLFCRFPEKGQPLDLAREFKQKMTPIVIDIDESDVFAANIAKIEAALDAAHQARDAFAPLLSMKRNAARHAPQYRLTLRVDQVPLMEGAVNRRTLSLVWDDPIPNWVLTRVLTFVQAIPDVDVEAEDDAGKLLRVPEGLAPQPTFERHAQLHPVGQASNPQDDREYPKEA